jgi:hypothetical protein
MSNKTDAKITNKQKAKAREFAIADAENAPPPCLRDKSVNLYDDEYEDVLQKAIDTLRFIALQCAMTKKNKVFNEGPRLTLTIIPDGRIIISQNSKKVHSEVEAAARELFGERVCFFPSKQDKYQLINTKNKDFGYHAEMKGYYYAMEKIIPKPEPELKPSDLKQFSSHYACDDCASKQEDLGKINKTNRTEFEEDNKCQTRPIDPYPIMLL